MPFLFHGQLAAHLCRDCSEPLFPARVRLYRAVDGPDLTQRAAAAPKHTLSLLDDDEVKAKRKRLLAEADLDELGRFTVAFDDGYDGEPFELDVAVDPASRDGRGEPAQFTVTTLQPAWREHDDGLHFAWDYALPERFWCRLRERLGLWVICGRALYCIKGDERRPAAGVRVSAFDRDWIQDDALGSAVTDAQGRFVIPYTPAAFRPGTFADIELVGGPDVYFRVETTIGTPLLTEPPQRGRSKDRENVGPCFCEELCIDGKDAGDPPDQPEPQAVFSHLGQYDFVDGAAPLRIDTATGLTAGDGRAFYGAVRLNGTLPKTISGSPLEYRFEYLDLNLAGGGWTPIDPTSDLVRRQEIGKLQKHLPDGPDDPNPNKETPVYVKGATGELTATINGNWIQVPQQDNAFPSSPGADPEGYFVPNHDMLLLDTTQLGATTGNADMGGSTGIKAGDSTLAYLSGDGQTAPSTHPFALRMFVRAVDPDGSTFGGILAGSCGRVGLNNHQYERVHAHPDWNGQDRTLRALAMINAAELEGNGCGEITDSLTVRVSASHPTLGAVSVRLKGPGGPFVFSPPAASDPSDVHGTAAPPAGFDVTSLPPCAYLLEVSARPLLTTGDSSHATIEDEVAFVKG